MLTTPTLVLRATNGSPLTITQGDENWTLIQNFLVALNAQVAGAINDNSTLKMYFDDIGTPNALQVNPAQYAGSPAAGDYASGYFQGMVYLIKAANTNTGAATLAVASSGSAFLTAVPITIDGTTALIAGAIQAGQIFMVVYDATSSSFIASNFINATQASAIAASLSYLLTNIAWITRYQPSPNNGLNNPRLFFHDLGTANAYLINYCESCQIPPSVYPAVYTDGMVVLLMPAGTNTGASTLAISNSASTYLPAKSIYRHGAALTGGEMVSGGLNVLVYDATTSHFLLA